MKLYRIINVILYLISIIFLSLYLVVHNRIIELIGYSFLGLASIILLIKLILTEKTNNPIVGKVCREQFGDGAIIV